MIDKDTPLDVIETRYRELSQLIKGGEALPKQVNECKLQAPPVIPVEFRRGKMPSNVFFASYTFTILDMCEQLKELQKMYGDLLPKELKSKIDKGE